MMSLPKRLLPLALGAVAITTTVAAQDQATTLAEACRRADVVVTATVTRTTDPSPAWRRLEWRADERLAGQVPATFTLTEPAGACCGRSLFALTPGQQRLLFLRRTGPLLHPFGGARGVLTATPALRSHVLALLATHGARDRAALLARCLDHDEPRIARDAAHELARMPALALAGNSRQRALQALRLAVHRGLTTAPSLLEVAVRGADTQCIDAMLELYLEQPRADRAAMLRSGLLRVRPELVTARLPAHLQRDRDRELRAAELLQRISGPHGRSAMQALLLRTSCPRVELRLAEGLLAAGVPVASLRHEVPRPVLNLALRRAHAAHLRTIRPRRR